jgi:hypothetical protein
MNLTEISPPPVLDELGGVTQSNITVTPRPIPSSKLETAAARINSLYREIDTAARMSLEKAVEIGRLLLEEKRRLAHGQWERWVDENIDLSKPTAWRYMRLWERRATIESFTVKDLSQAYKLLAPPTKTNAVKPPAPSELKPDVAPPPSPEQEPEPEEPPHIKYRPSSAMEYAEMAILQLDKINLKDTQRDDALDHIIAWINKERNDGKPTVEVSNWEPGLLDMPSPGQVEDVSNDNDTLCTLKRYWRKASMKDRKAFWSWANKEVTQ